MDLKEFTDLITQFGNDVKKIYALSYTAMQGSNCKVISVALEIIRSASLRFFITRGSLELIITMGSFINEGLVRGGFRRGKNKKLAYLINAGEPVNQVGDLERKKTLLQKLLDNFSSDKVRALKRKEKRKVEKIERKKILQTLVDDFSSSDSSSDSSSEEFLRNSFIGMLIAAGGVTYNEITEEQQELVDKIMQPIVCKINVLFVLFEETYLRNELPVELKSIIYVMTMDGLKFGPEIIRKILSINRG